MEKPWFKFYPDGVPHDIHPEEYRSIVDFFEASVAKFANRPAYSNLGCTITYGELDFLSKRFAAYLQSSTKLKPGDRIAIQMPNLIQYPIVMFGAIRAGLVIVNTNPLYTPREMKHQFNDAGIKAIVILANFANHLESILPDTKIEEVILTEIGDALPPVKRNIVNFVIRRIKKMVPNFNLPNSVKYNTAMNIGTRKNFTPVDVNPDDIAFLQYTGGTTGVSKGAMLTHRNIVSNMLMIKAWMKPILEEGNEIVITALPLYHIFSLTVNCLTFSAYGGHNILITNPKDIDGFIKELIKTKFTTFTGVNTLYNALMNHPKFSDINFSNLKLGVAGGMALQTSVAARWKELTGSTIIEGFGLTETSPVLTVNPVGGGDRPGMIGIPVPSTEVRIVDENRKPLSVGEPGEIQGRGPQVMQGYWNRIEDTNAVIDDDGWFSTGDIGIMDEDGFFKIVDRKKDMILVSGFNVYPNEVEDIIAAHPKVLEVAVIGIPDERSGEQVKAFIVKKDDSLSESELDAFCREQLTSYKSPKFFEFRKELPKTNVGKILRRALKEEEKEKAKV